MIPPDKQANNRTPNGQFIAGSSGNPKGRPCKEQSLAFLMAELLNYTQDGESKSNKEKFIEKVYEMAINGDHTAIKLVWNYIDGMPLNRSEITGKNGTPLLPTEISEETEAEIQQIIDEQLISMESEGK